MSETHIKSQILSNEPYYSPFEESLKSIFQTLKKECIESSGLHQYVSINKGKIFKKLPCNLHSQTKLNINTLNSIQNLTKCYSYMNASLLINQLTDAWDEFCKENTDVMQQLNRKLINLKGDPKADPQNLAVTESLYNMMSQCCVLSNVGFYRIRLLKRLYSKN